MLRHTNAADETSADGAEPPPLEARARAKRQLIGALLVAYGAAEGLFLGMLFLVGLQAANDETALLLPFFLMLSIPGGLTVVGLGLVRDRRWAYWAALLLPILIVPVGVWWITKPGGKRERLWVEFLGPFGAGAFLALGTVVLSAVLLFTRRRGATVGG